MLKMVPLKRRYFMASALSGAVGFHRSARAVEKLTASPPSVISQPPRQWGDMAGPGFFPDPDVIALDPSFNDLLYGSAQIKRIWNKSDWAEGPAWSSEGRFLVFSDVVQSRMYRYIWETGEVTRFHDESYASNGNTFDFQGRLITCEGFFRRVIRWEHDGSVTVLADRYQGQGLNSPNDVVAHPDGSVRFTDPSYGTNLSERQV